MNLLLILFGIFTSSLAQRPKLQGRIVGGHDCEISDYPHQLSLRIGGRHNCGASVIALRYALTAAHCLEKRTFPEVSLLGGSNNYGTGGKIFEATAIFMHPDYNSRRSDYDVGLIKTKSDMVGENIQQIKIPSMDDSFYYNPGKILTVSGWGYMAAGEQILPDHLKCVEVPIVEQDTCNTALAAYGGVRATMFCAGAPGKDACQGDSGGPIVSNDVQIGVVGGGLECGSADQYGVYTRLSQAGVRSFILNVAKV